MFDDQFKSQARADYARARLKAFVHSALAALSGESNSLLSYDDVKEKLRIGGPIYRGMKTVRVDQIIGSLNRYHEFDRTFLPTHDKNAERWQNIDRAFYGEVSLPPVVLYKVADVYFVVDGHHRVSVAREQHQIYIDAEVRECATKVKFSADIQPEDLEILGEKVDFIERTQIDRLLPGVDIYLNIPDGFSRMLEHIAVHRYFMGLEQKRDISESEAVIDWYHNVYMPIVNVIRASNILEEFPDKTEGDLYLWVLDHQHDLAEQGHELQSPSDAAREFIEEKDNKEK